MKYKLPILFCLSIFISNSITAQGYQWAKGIISDNPEMGQKIVTDNNGRIILMGSFSGSADFDPGSSTEMLQSASNADVFIAKYNTDGSYVWAKSIGGVGNDVCKGLVTDDAGNVYIAGYFNGTADFDPGNSTVNLQSNGTDSSDAFFAKYDAQGNLVWAKRFGSTYSDIAYGIDVDAAGNVYISGYFSGTVDFDPNNGTTNLTSTGKNVYFAKYTSSGSLTWARQLAGANGECWGIDVNLDNNITVTGYFLDTVDFDPGAAVRNITSMGEEDFFVARYDAQGNFIWVNTMGNIGSDVGRSIVTDTLGNVYVAGDFELGFDFNPGLLLDIHTSLGGTDVFFIKYNDAGTYQWGRSVGSFFGLDRCYGLALDEEANVYIGGYIDNTADFDVGSGILDITPLGGHDAYFAKYTSTGNFIWAESASGPLNEITRSITIDGNDNLYTTGYFNGTVDFNPAASINSLTSPDTGSVFFAKYGKGGGPLGIDEFATTSFSLYPNPATNSFVVDLGSYKGEAVVSIYTTEGKLVQQLINNQSPKEEINTAAYLPGIYFVRIQTAETTYTQKLIVTK